jgi:hypothetical protein
VWGAGEVKTKAKGFRLPRVVEEYCFRQGFRWPLISFFSAFFGVDSVTSCDIQRNFTVHVALCRFEQADLMI